MIIYRAYTKDLPEAIRGEIHSQLRCVDFLKIPKIFNDCKDNFFETETDETLEQYKKRLTNRIYKLKGK